MVPLIQMIDTWFRNRRLALAFEAKVGKGKLLVCSIDLRKESDQNPVAPQMLRSLTRYLTGDRFQPPVELTAAQVRGLLAP